MPLARAETQGLDFANTSTPGIRVEIAELESLERLREIPAQRSTDAQARCPFIGEMTNSSPAHSAVASPAAVLRSVSEVRRHVREVRVQGGKVTLVPTMGALHDGHLALVRSSAARGEHVVVSVFVNPAQFAPHEDLDRYPRQEATDVELAREAGALAIFAPPVGEVYPAGFATTISVDGPARGFEGELRPSHFAGVATVVAKLLLMVRPDRLVLGQKDAQQVAVVRRMMRDLNLDDIDLVVHPIVREDDGLAMSSRNRYLSANERRAARAMPASLAAAQREIDAGETDAAGIAAAARRVLEDAAGVRPDYAAVVDPNTFSPLTRLDRPAVLCVAARVGPTRLLDNAVLIPT